MSWFFSLCDWNEPVFFLPSLHSVASLHAQPKMDINNLPTDLLCAILRKVSEGAPVGILLALRGVSCRFREACCQARMPFPVITNILTAEYVPVSFPQRAKDIECACAPAPCGREGSTYTTHCGTRKLFLFAQLLQGRPLDPGQDSLTVNVRCRLNVHKPYFLCIRRY